MTKTYYARFPSTYAGRLSTITAQLFDEDETPVAPVYAGAGAPGDGVIYETSNGGYAIRITHADAFEGTIRWDTGGADPRTADEPITPELETATNEILDAIGGITGGGGAPGDTMVDHNGVGTTVPGELADVLSYMTSIGGIGIGDAEVIAYLKSDYDAGNYTVRQRTTTNAAGQWVAPLMLDSGTVYTLYYRKEGVYGPDTTEITVE